MSEVVQGQVFDFERVASGPDLELIWGRDVVELAVVTGSHGLEAITDVLTVKLHDQAH